MFWEQGWRWQDISVGKKYNLPFMNMHIMLHFNMENVLLMRPDYLCANFGLYSQSVFESKLRDVIVCNTSWCYLCYGWRSVSFAKVQNWDVSCIEISINSTLNSELKQKLLTCTPFLSCIWKEKKTCWVWGWCRVSWMMKETISYSWALIVTHVFNAFENLLLFLSVRHCCTTCK